MHQPRRLRFTASIILCFALQALGADKYTDENRPYEFGFKIDGEQHRHESKDKDGIIMGEFGFITADDVYHVTVYATDKEGRFKILSMKNIHLKASPASNLGVPSSARQGHALALPPAQPASVQASAVSREPPKQAGPTPVNSGPFTQQSAPKSQGAVSPQPGKLYKPVPFEPPAKSCSSCSLPTTTTRAPPPVYNQVTENNNYNSPNTFIAPESSPQNQQGLPISSPGQQNILQGGPIGSSYNPQGAQQAFPPSSPGQQNTLKEGPIGSSYNPQGGQQAFPPSSPGQRNTPQGGPSGSSYPQGVQQPYPPLTTAQQNTAQGGPSGSTYNPQGGQPNYPSSQINIPQQELLAPDGVPSFAPQPSQTAPNNPDSSSYSQGPSSPNAPNYAQSRGAFPSAGQNQGEAFKQAGLRQTDSGEQNRLFNGNNNPYAGAGPSGSASTVPDYNPQAGAGDRTAKQYNGPEQQFNSKLGSNGSPNPGAAFSGQRGSAKPTLYSAQMQIVDKNTDIYALGPNEQKGLPPGLSQDDVTQLLYTFNYTVGFHGHFEEGYTNGVKKGYYFVTGRNGVRTRIDYVADDTGFHPKVSQEVLDLLSEDVPKPETEKDAKYGLKGYEFKWLYYPVESRRR